MSSHRHRHRHRHQTIRISILLRPNWFTARVLTVCSVCFKIYAAAISIWWTPAQTLKAVRVLPPPLHCIRYHAVYCSPGRRHLTVPPAATLTCALSCATLACLPARCVATPRRPTPRACHPVPPCDSLRLCTYAFTASLPRRLATACHLSPPTHGQPTKSGLGSGLGSVVRVRVRVRARISPRDACAYATPARPAPIVPRCHRPQPACLRYARRCDSVRLCAYSFTVLPRRLATACHLSPPTRGCRSHPLWLHPASPVLPLGLGLGLDPVPHPARSAPPPAVSHGLSAHPHLSSARCTTPVNEAARTGTRPPMCHRLGAQVHTAPTQ
eukprot:scaffold49689_cov61-Phaeocystis_antarctica.AAC.2